MDIASLKSELEQHLKGNPDDQAPEGFRDRFEQAAADHQEEDDAETKSAMEAALRRILDEAEAAASFAEEAGKGPRAPKASAPPAPGARPSAGAPAGGGAAPAESDRAAPEGGTNRAYAVAGAVIVAVLVGAFFYFRA